MKLSARFSISCCLAILLAIPFAAAQSTDVIAIAPEGFEPIANVIGVSVFFVFCFWLFRVARSEITA